MTDGVPVDAAPALPRPALVVSRRAPTRLDPSHEDSRAGGALSGHVSRAGYVIAAVVLGVAAARLARGALASATTPYYDLTSGALATAGGYKRLDYGFVAVLLISVPLAWSASTALGRRLDRQGPDSATVLGHALGVACLPAAYWLASAPTQPDSGWLSLAAGLVCWTIGAALVASAAAGRAGVLKVRLDDALLLVSLPVLALLGAAGASRAARMIWVSLSSKAPPGDHVAFVCFMALFLTAAIALVAMLPHGAPSQRLRLAVVLLQLPALLTVLVALPEPWLARGGGAYFGHPMRDGGQWFWLLALAICIGAADLVRRAFLVYGGGHPRLLSPLVAAAAIVAVKHRPHGMPSLPNDDYHFGELLTPWGQWLDFGALPYADLSPPRGLLPNYAPQAINDLLFGGGAGTLPSAVPPYAMLLIAMVFPLYRFALGSVPAVTALVLLPLANGFAEIDLIMGAGMCVLAAGLVRWAPGAWLAVWLPIGVLLVLVSPAQGIIVCLATTPLAALSLWRTRGAPWPALRPPAAVAALLLILLAVLTPLQRALAGALRYFFEQSAVNTTAFGVPWELPGGWGSEIVRSGPWVGVALLAVLSAMSLYRRRSGPVDASRVAILLSVFTALLIYIPRAAGRLADSPTRLGILSLWSAAVLLPLVLTFAWRRSNATALAAMAAGGALAAVAVAPTPLQEQSSPVFGNLLANATALSPAPEVLVDGASLGLPGLGTAAPEPLHLARLLNLERSTRALGLEPGDQYLDLTNHGANYAYLGRRSPQEVLGPYNLTAPEQVSRNVERLRVDPPSAVLANAENQLHDGGTLGLRVPSLYRWILQTYDPIALPGSTWMVPKDGKPMTPERLSLLDGAFHPSDLGLAPSSWGRSWETLEKRLRPTTGARVVGPAVVFDRAVSGREGGVLELQIGCGSKALSGAKAPPGRVGVDWSSGSAGADRAEADLVSGRLLLPLDAYPRWLLADRVASVQISLTAAPSCPVPTLQSASLLQRPGVTS